MYFSDESYTEILVRLPSYLLNFYGVFSLKYFIMNSTYPHFNKSISSGGNKCEKTELPN
jgi:hypothetical protein